MICDISDKISDDRSSCKKQKCDNREVQKILPKYISRLERTLKFMKIISFASNLCILTFFSVVVIPFCDGLLRENPRANAKNPSAQIQFKRRKGNGKRISNLHEKSLGVLWPRQKYWGKPKSCSDSFQNFVDLTCHVSSAFTVIPQQQINRDKANDIKCERRRRQELLVIRA